MLHLAGVRRLTAVFILAGVALLAAAAAAGGRETVLIRTRGPIDAIAFDGGRAAWAGYRGQCMVVVRGVLASGARAPLTRCLQTFGFGLQDIALAGRRVVGVNVVCGIFETVTKVVAVRRYRHVARREWSLAGCGAGDCVPGAVGKVVGPIAGAGPTAVFALLRYGAPPDCGPETCKGVYLGGDLRRVEVHGRDLRAARVPGAPAAALLDVAAGRVALAPLVAGEEGLVAQPRVEIRRVDSGALRAAITPDGTPLGLALSRRYLALLVDDAGRRRLELYRVPGGERVATAPVRAPIRDWSIAVAAGRVAYHLRGAIRLWDAIGGRFSTVAQPHRPTMGLAIERGHVLWAYGNVKVPRRHGEILAAPVPRRR